MIKWFVVVVVVVVLVVFFFVGCVLFGIKVGSMVMVLMMMFVQKQVVISVFDFGGFDGLVVVVNVEGYFNVIILLLLWVNYGKIIQGFEKKYLKIKINFEIFDGFSVDEVVVVKVQKGQLIVLDVFDVGIVVMNQNFFFFVFYKVQSWDFILVDFKDEYGYWWYDYMGFMLIGYDSKKFLKGIKSLSDLFGLGFKNLVVIKGDLM